jgi:hypothetical protein
VAEPGYTPPEKATAAEIQKLKERLNRLERPTGSQNNRNRDKVQAALEDLQFQADRLKEQQEELARQLQFSQSPTAAHSVISGFDLTSTPEELIRLTFTMPDGFTRAMVYGSTTISVFNQNGGLADVLRCYLQINGAGATSTPTPVFVPPLSGQSMSANYGELLTLPAGSEFWVRAVAYNQLNNTGAATNLNVCNIDATVLFLR